MSDESLEPSEAGHEGEHLHDTPPVPTPEVSGSAIPLPPIDASAPVTPEHGTPEVSAPTPDPTQPSIVPSGGANPQSSAYALGVLSGNPRLGPSAGPGYYGPPTNQNPPIWPAPPAAGSSARPSGTHRLRNGVVVAAAIVVAVAAGAGISHAAWTSNSPTISAAPASHPFHTPSSSGSGGNGGTGSFGSPFGSGNSGSSSGTGGSGGSGPSDVSAIAAKVDPGLVDIDTTLGYQSEQAAGTGIVVTSSGEVLTNNHVINGATTISATDVGNGKTYSASVVGYDRTKDIAVLQLHNASGLQTATLSDSSKAAVGEDVVGVGNAGGTGGTPSAAGGTVTALNQSITASDQGDGSSENLTGLIQTNANIQAGDSGGALVNTSGEVVGIDTAASAGFSFQSQGQSAGNQGYAIPINEAVSLAKSIIAGDASSTIHIGPTAFLGVEISSAASSSGGSGSGSGSSNPFGVTAPVDSATVRAPSVATRGTPGTRGTPETRGIPETQGAPGAPVQASPPRAR